MIFCGDNFDATLFIFRSHHYGTNASEEVEKIIRDKKKLSQIILVLYNLHS